MGQMSELWGLDYIVGVFGVLLGVAFFTLTERKVLGYIHFRKGPSKLLYFGLLQPISDAVKLFFKELFKGYSFYLYLFLIGPVTGLFLMLVLWGSYVSYCGGVGSLFFSIYVFAFFSLGVYFLLFCGWGSGSKYSLVGCYRSISQTVSYEVSFIFFVLAASYLVSSYDFSVYFFFQCGYWFSLISVLFVGMWGYVCLAESNRTPFDFSEGESELVSGFNVEYSGGSFSLIFICEYGMIIFISFFSILLFLGSFNFVLKLLFLCFFFIWVRGVLPRYRYDLLMGSAWKKVLPFSLFFLIFVASVFC